MAPYSTAGLLLCASRARVVTVERKLPPSLRRSAGSSYLWETALFAVFHSVHIVFYGAKNFNNVEPRTTGRESPDLQRDGDLEVDAGRDRRSWGILSGFFRRVEPGDLGITHIARS